MIDLNGDVNKAIADLLAAAKEVGGEAFPMLVRRTYIRAITTFLAWGAFLPAVWIAATRISKRIYEHEIARTNEDLDPGFKWIPIVVAAIVSVIGLIILSDALTDLLAPEGGVLLRLLGRGR